jgi:predicted nuclease of predicted toxin-antitoxin system
MFRLLADEDFNNRILRGLQRREPGIDIVRVQDVEELAGHPDPDVLEWAARENRIILSHDKETLVGFAWDRVRRGLPMPGVFLVEALENIGTAVDELAVIVGASEPEEYRDRVVFIPI